MLKSSPIFKRNDAHLVEKKDVWKKQGLSTIEVWMLWTYKNIFDLSSFEHVNLLLMEHISKKNMTIQTIMFPLWSSKHTKMQF